MTRSGSWVATGTGGQAVEAAGRAARSGPPPGELRTQHGSGRPRAGEQIRRPPPRSASPVSPVPRPLSAPPRPLSLTSTASTPRCRRAVTRALVAPLCRATLVSASATTKYVVFSMWPGGRAASGASTVTGTAAESASSSRAAGRPRSVRTCGWMPWMSCRSSSMSWRACSCAAVTAGAAGEPGGRSSRARPSCMVRVTSFCWAPSCRSRSIRRRSASKAPASRTRDRAISVSSARSSSPGPLVSSARATAAYPPASSVTR